MSDETGRAVRIVVVGPCGAGKTTLVQSLRPKGYDIRSCVQEHSGMPDLWQRFSRAEVLVYLDAELATIAQRQGRSDWTEHRLATQRERLAHARAHCDLYLATDQRTRDEVAALVEAYLRGRGIAARGGEALANAGSERGAQDGSGAEPPIRARRVP